MSIFRSRCVQGVVLRPLPGQCRGHCQEFGFYSRVSQRYTCNWEVPKRSGLHDGCHSGYPVVCFEGAAVGQGKNGAW